MHLALSFDDRFLEPASATLLSALEQLPPGTDIALHLLQIGVGADAKCAVETLLDRPGVKVLWYPLVEVFPPELRGNPRLAYYGRLYIESLLPKDVQRVLYLDSDILVRKSLVPLWETDLGGMTMGAVLNFGLPTTGSVRSSLFREKGIPGDTSYFNVGVMLLDLVRWRQRHYSLELQRLLRGDLRVLRFYDQCLLNAVLHGDIHALPPQWNYWSRFHLFPAADRSPFSDHDFRTAVCDPAIVHFPMAGKPWLPSCPSPYRYEFREVWNRVPGASPLRRSWNLSYFRYRLQEYYALPLLRILRRRHLRALMPGEARR